jgi:hypothetical protein
MTIHKAAMPRELRDAPAGISDCCWGEVMFSVTLCQKSDVAIFSPMTSRIQRFVDNLFTSSHPVQKWRINQLKSNSEESHLEP